MPPPSITVCPFFVPLTGLAALHSCAKHFLTVVGRTTPASAEAVLWEAIDKLVMHTSWANVICGWR